MCTAFAFSVGGLAEATLPNFFLREAAKLKSRRGGSGAV